jgi:hypothetical protein
MQLSILRVVSDMGSTLSKQIDTKRKDRAHPDTEEHYISVLLIYSLNNLCVNRKSASTISAQRL